LETDLFYQGIRPALNVGISVSRVGSAAQTKAIKKVAGKLRLDMAQFRELAAFAQFASDLDPQTKARIELGRGLPKFEANQYDSMSVGHQVAVIYAVTNGYLGKVAVEDVKIGKITFINSSMCSTKNYLKKLLKIKDFAEIENDLKQQSKNLIKATESNQ
jgi:F0F1-type ATP synthase alpha subunit